LGDNGNAGCPTGNGDDGKLIAKGAAAPAGCLPPVGHPYIELNQKDGTNNLPSGQTLEDTFSCMASVGDGGCGFEQQLESVHRALERSTVAADVNAGFLRDDALLAVVWVTDEDDCSAPPTSDVYSSLPSSAGLGALTSFRCVRWGYLCDGQPVPFA